MKKFKPSVTIRVRNLLTDQPRVLLWTLWRSGTHWMSDMLSDLLDLPAYYASDDRGDYRTETVRQIEQFPRNKILVRHICLEPGEVFNLAERFDFRIVFLYRDPRDVLASSVNMRKYHEGYRPGLPAFPEMAIADILHWELATYSTTFRELLPAWAEARHCRLITVRYEDLHRDAHAILTSIAHFLSVEKQGDEVQRIADANNFETRTGRQPGNDNPTAHNRKGVVGDHRSVFTTTEQAKMNAILHESLVQLNYAA